MQAPLDLGLHADATCVWRSAIPGCVRRLGHFTAGVAWRLLINVDSTVRVLD
jgi:hypothetical protein